MKIAVIHSSLNQFGGAERLCATMVKTLQKAGNKVTLVTFDKTNWPLLEKKYGLTCKLDQELFLIPNALETASTTKRAALTLSSFFIMSAILKLQDRYHLVINTSGEIMNLMEDIVYINAIPMRAAFDYPEVLPVRSSLWRYYSRAYDFFLKAVEKFNSDSYLLTNSKFSEAAIRKCFGRRASVIYPPVDVGRFKKYSGSKARKNLVITVSRFRPGKNLEYVPRVAEIVRNSRFLIIGPSDETSQTTINEINKSAKRLNASERIDIVTNSPLSVLLQGLSEAKVYLHTQFSEAFGMSVVEAMAAGCVPIVPRNGGPWFDILDQKQGKYGYSYRTVEEAAKLTSMLLENNDLREKVSTRARQRALDFDGSIFEKNIIKVVEAVYSRKTAR
jgi:alpha-1,2-mannosyltransferase